MTSTQDIAATAEKAIEGFMKVEPTIATIASMFVPGAAPIVAVVHPAVVLAAPFVENALLALAAGHNGDAFSAFIELLQHLTAGHQNSSILGAPAAPDSLPASQDPSAQGSG